MSIILSALLALLMCAAASAQVPDETRTRVIVSTDISTLVATEGEPDDTESMVRFLLYTNEFDVEGLIASHANYKSRVNPDYIRALVNLYGQVRDNLALHDPRYPTAQYLLDRVKAGYPTRNRIGIGFDTEASDWIISVVDNPDPRPVWFIAWGGTREVAQALWRVQTTRSAAELKAFRNKIRIYAIADQDSTPPWIRTNHPSVFYITNYYAFRGMYRDGDTSLVTPAWVDTNIRFGHGPLGAVYPNYKGGDPWGQVKGIKEGDTPSFLYLIPNGLGSLENPSWGSWGGRFLGAGPQFFDTKDTVGSDTSERATTYRWRLAFQSSFRARLDWCVMPPDQANHEPVAEVHGELTQTVAPTQMVQLSAVGSYDPDGGDVTYNWDYYPEPGSYEGPLSIKHSDKKHAMFVAPNVLAPQTIHIILTVTDSGQPALRSYKRIIVTVDPNAPLIED